MVWEEKILWNCTRLSRQVRIQFVFLYEVKSAFWLGVNKQNNNNRKKGSDNHAIKTKITDNPHDWLKRKKTRETKLRCFQLAYDWLRNDASLPDQSCDNLNKTNTVPTDVWKLPLVKLNCCIETSLFEPFLSRLEFNVGFMVILRYVSMIVKQEESGGMELKSDQERLCIASLSMKEYKKFRSKNWNV